MIINQPLLKNRYRVTFIDPDTDTDILTIQTVSIKVDHDLAANRFRLNYTSNDLFITIESDCNANTIKTIFGIGDKTINIRVDNLDGSNGIYFSELYSACKFSSVAWDHNYASAASLDYKLHMLYETVSFE